MTAAIIIGFMLKPNAGLGLDVAKGDLECKPRHADRRDMFLCRRLTVTPTSRAVCPNRISMIGFAFVLLIAAALWPVSHRLHRKFPSLPERRRRPF